MGYKNLIKCAGNGGECIEEFSLNECGVNMMGYSSWFRLRMVGLGLGWVCPPEQLGADLTYSVKGSPVKTNWVQGADVKLQEANIA